MEVMGLGMEDEEATVYVHLLAEPPGEHRLTGVVGIPQDYMLANQRLDMYGGMPGGGGCCTIS